MLEGTKSIFTSTTFLGVLVSVVAIVLGMFKIQLLDQAGWVTDLGALVGAAVALYGRVKATKKIAGFIFAMLFAATSLNVMAAPPDSWSRDQWKYIGKEKKVAVYHLVVDSDGIASGDMIYGVGPDLPANAIITKVYYHISTAFVGANDNPVSLNCVASSDLINGATIHADAQYTVAAGAVDGGAASTFVKTTSAGCSPTFYVGDGASGYSSGQLQALVEYVQLYPAAGLDE